MVRVSLRTIVLAYVIACATCVVLFQLHDQKLLSIEQCRGWNEKELSVGYEDQGFDTPFVEHGLDRLHRSRSRGE